jgi:hypothetical protein
VPAVPDVETEIELGEVPAVPDVETEIELEEVPAVLRELDETVPDELMTGGATGADVLSM